MVLRNKDDVHMQGSTLATKAADQETKTQGIGTVELRHAHRTVTTQELDAARNCVSASQHTKITLLPNHAINSEGERDGFVFECCCDDSASVLPLTKSSFATTAVYECLQDTAAFRELSSNATQTAARVLEVIRDIQAEPAEPLKFDCMPDWENAALTHSRISGLGAKAFRRKLAYTTLLCARQRRTCASTSFLLSCPATAAMPAKSCTTCGSTPVTTSQQSSFWSVQSSTGFARPRCVITIA